MTIRKHKVDELVRAFRAMGHAVRLDEVSDDADVRRKQQRVKQLRASMTKEEQQAAWKILGDR